MASYIEEMATRKNRVSRKNKRASRKNKRASRKNRRNSRRFRGGMAPVNDSSMAMAQKDSLSQGGQYLSMHKGQYGGSVGPYPSSVLSSGLPDSMIASSRTGPLNSAIASIQGMQDGGRRKSSAKKRSSKTRRGRKYRGGNHFLGAPLSANSMLLPPGLEKQAALNYEWSAAKDLSMMEPKH